MANRKGLWMVALALTGCADIGQGRVPEIRGLIVDYRLAPEAAPKHGVDAVTDTGARLFGPAELNRRNGGVSSYGGATLPRWADVTWHAPDSDFKMAWNAKEFENGRMWVRGTLSGRYRVEIANRLPVDVLNYVSSGRGRAIRLQFRLRDDGVLLAWDVQERVKHPKGGSGWVWSMHGGDFPCEPEGRAPQRCTEGRLEDAPWYLKEWIRD